MVPKERIVVSATEQDGKTEGEVSRVKFKKNGKKGSNPGKGPRGICGLERGIRPEVQKLKKKDVRKGGRKKEKKKKGGKEKGWETVHMVQKSKKRGKRGRAEKSAMTKSYLSKERTEQGGEEGFPVIKKGQERGGQRP